VDQPIIWKEITTAFEGRAIGGSWAVEDGVVSVRTAAGMKQPTLTPDQDGVSTAYPLVYHAALARSSGGVCMSRVKKEDARRAILSEYERWSKKHPGDAVVMGGFLFFRCLQNERSDLLDFRAVGSKWQIVHGWIWDRVKD